MPELAEVEYFKRVWSPAENTKVTEVMARLDKRIFREIKGAQSLNCLNGSTFSQSFRKGKQLCFLFDQDKWLGLHMGMTGKLKISEEPDEAFKYGYLILFLEDGRRLIFEDPRLFGKVLFSQGSRAPDWWAKLPDEILSDSFTFQSMNTFLERRPRSLIKPLLLEQSVFPGIGNWMADEILWRSQIAPFVRVAEIDPDKREELYSVIREVCVDSLEVIADGWKKPPNSWLFNHRWKDNGICPKTKQVLKREKIGGRTACWSPDWQVYR